MAQVTIDVPGGTITSAKGFLAGATHAGLKQGGGLDLGICYSEVPCVAVGLFTQNRVKSAPVLLSQRHLENGRAQAIVANAGCANACTGDRGMKDAREMARRTAERLGLEPEDVLVASTGVIGVGLPIQRIRRGIEAITFSRQGGHALASAITTTDTFAKEIAVLFTVDGMAVDIGGVAKGAGMIHPDLATMLCFLATDAVVDGAFMERALRAAVEVSFNMVTIDGDTSPSDMVLMLANGVAANKPIAEGTAEGEAFQAALTDVCVHLARCVARDGEGATRLIEVTVEGAASVEEARVAARTVAGSPLVKTAVHGGDPNWGRIVAALGRSGAQVDCDRIDVFLRDMCLMERGAPCSFGRDQAREALMAPEVPITVRLNVGPGSATAWGCDLSEDYVKINSEYTT